MSVRTTHLLTTHYSPLPMNRHVIIIGGGVIGAACAHYLVKSSWQVTVIDRGRFGHGCSHGNCGFVCPSHVLPLAMPGAVRRTFKALFQPNSPLSIKPRLDPSLWSWLLHFARRCNLQDMLTAGRAIQAETRPGVDWLNKLKGRLGEIHVRIVLHIARANG